MAAIGALTLFDPTTPLTAFSGAAFGLTDPSPVGVSLTLDGATTEVTTGQREIVTRLSGQLDLEPTLHRAYSSAQQALDLISLRSRVQLAIRAPALEHKLWAVVNGRMTLRSVGSVPYPLPEIRATATITRLDGSTEVVRPPDHYSAALRFYRLAHATDDVYETFRNLYLAFEHLVSEQSAKGSEHEPEWLKRVLGTAATITDLGPITPDRDPIKRADRLVSGIYDVRVRLFHAKVGRGSYLPHDSLVEQTSVGDQCRILAYLVVRMLDEWHQVRGSRGEFSNYAIARIADQLWADSIIVASADTSQLGPDNGGLDHSRFQTGLRMTTICEAVNDAVGEYLLVGSVANPAESGLAAVQRFDVIDSDGVLLTQTEDALLELSGVAEFEHVIRAFAHASWTPRALATYKYRAM